MNQDVDNMTRAELIDITYVSLSMPFAPDVVADMEELFRLEVKLMVQIVPRSTNRSLTASRRLLFWMPTHIPTSDFLALQALTYNSPTTITLTTQNSVIRKRLSRLFSTVYAALFGRALFWMST